MAKKDFDIVVTIKLCINDGTYTITSNATKEGQFSILENAVRDQFGKGVDNRPPNRELDVFTIHIWYTLDDEINISHDCGNDGLMTGILADVFSRESSNIKDDRRM